MINNLEPQNNVCDLSSGQTADIIGMELPDKIQERLAGLGLNLGARFVLIQGGNGTPYVLAADETRIAIGADLADKIFVKPQTASGNPA